MANQNVKRIVTPEVFVAYSQCKLKTYSLLFENIKSNSIEYVDVLNEKTRKAKLEYLKKVRQKHSDIKAYSIEEMRSGINTARRKRQRLLCLPQYK